MVFLHNDFYTASGSVKLYNCWTDKVTKFDTSSFYNWEQDNLPIYDLEERTYYLWEKLGHPTSSLPGVGLVVSAGGSPGDYLCNKNIFETLQDAIEALPEVLNYPVIIEICNIGDLGALNLKNIKCGPNGSLEIVNKVFAKIEPYQGTTVINRVAKQTVDTNYYNLAAFFSGGPLGVATQFYDTKSELLNKRIFTDYSDIDTKLNNKLNGMSIRSDTSLASCYSIPTYTVSSLTVGSPTLVLFPYEIASIPEVTSLDLPKTYDISAFDETLGTQLTTVIDPGVLPGTLQPHTGLTFGNKLSKISITNCDGTIYVRNFFIDGSRYPNTRNDVGVEINNSEKIVLENCVSIRNRKAGFYFNNSKVIITRGIAAYRNYNTPRVVDTDTYQQDLGAGLLAINSEVNFSSTSAFEYNLAVNDPVYSTSLTGTNQLAYGLNYPINFHKNANGIVLENSKFYGGVSGTKPTQLIADFNNYAGIKLFNSQFEWDGRLILEGNHTGLLADNSVVNTDKFIVRYNQRNGVHLNNSNFIYNKNFTNEGATQFHYNKNGTHLLLNNSNYECTIVSSMPTKIGGHRFENSHAVSKDISQQSQPSIKVFNSSKCLLIHPKIIRDESSVSIVNTDPYAKYGLALSVLNNSKVTLKGSKNYANIIKGPSTQSIKVNSAGAYASNNSIINIQGPTVVAQFDVDCLAENNSVINITPHLDESTNNLQISEFNLNDDLNHTMVELHSNRACLVANKSSVINLQDLGYYASSWSNSTVGAEALLDVPDYSINGKADYIKGGHLQFYPNPNDSDVNQSLTGVNFNNNNYPHITSQYYSYLINRATSLPNDFSSVTLGGMCVRAVEDSIINVRNVNFPCGWWNASGPFYNYTAGNSVLCSYLFIWNICDSSKLNASYCSVSSLFPQSAGYHGPLSVWLSAFNSETLEFTGRALSGLPLGTPDTSSLSIFDYFGAWTSSVSSLGFFTSANANQGPFRLYFSVDPASNFLNLISGIQTTTSGYYNNGWLNQIYSQGYQPPFSMSSVSSTSTIYKSLLNRSGSSLYLSGYYYGSSMIVNPREVRALLDESAAHTFANAKHCSVGKSGLAKLVNIYFPYEEYEGGESASTAYKALGNGVLSVNVFDLNRNN